MLSVIFLGRSWTSVLKHLTQGIVLIFGYEWILEVLSGTSIEVDNCMLLVLLFISIFCQGLDNLCIYLVHVHRYFILQWHWYHFEPKNWYRPALVMGYINDSTNDKILSFLCNLDFPNEKIVGTILFQVHLKRLTTIYDNDLLMGGQKK